MVDITHKSTSLRSATATAIVKLSSDDAMRMLLQQRVPKGNVLESARVAALFAVKHTSVVIPDCHPLPIESTAVSFECIDNDIHIAVTVKTIYRTGVEVEAMHGAAIAALTVYDMMKPVDKGIEISTIRLVEKNGGKSQYKMLNANGVRTSIIVCSDSVFAGTSIDRSGSLIREKLASYGINPNAVQIVPDDTSAIESAVLQSCTPELELLMLCGGTGVAARDVTTEVLKSIIDRELPGVAETMRHYGQERIPTAMLSRSIVGMRGHTLIIALPGSPRAVEECMDAIFPAILHVCELQRDSRHL